MPSIQANSRTLKFIAFTFAAFAFLFVSAAPTRAQRTKIKQVPEPPGPPVAENHVIDLDISKMLGAWQMGDAQEMHKFYADDVVVVSGAWEAPIYTWANYLPSYQSQHARMSSPRIDRTNTVVRIKDNSAWATYQFLYVAQTEGKVAEFRGHTTLVLVKQADRKSVV